MPNTRQSHCYINEGPLITKRFEGYIFVESLQQSSIYSTFWQHEWRLLWMRPQVRAPLSLVNLGKQGVNLDGFKIYQYSSSYDIMEKNFIYSLIQKPEYIIKKLSYSFNDVEEVMTFAKNSDIELGNGCNRSEGRNADDLNSRMLNLLLDNPLHLYSHKSNADLLDPLYTFDNPLWRLQHENGAKMKTPTIQIRPKGLVLPVQANEHNLPSVNISHVGCTAWVVIHPSSNEELVSRIAELDKLNKNRTPKNIALHCILRDKLYSVTLQQLNLWSIPHTVIFQEEGDVLVLLPGVIYFTFNLTFAIHSVIYYLPLGSKEIDVVQNFKKCRCFASESMKRSRHGEWISEIHLNVTKFVLEWMHSSLMAMIPKHPIMSQEGKQEPSESTNHVPHPSGSNSFIPSSCSLSNLHSNNSQRPPPSESAVLNRIYPEELVTMLDSPLPSISSFTSNLEEIDIAVTETLTSSYTYNENCPITSSNGHFQRNTVNPEGFHKQIEHTKESCFRNNHNDTAADKLQDFQPSISTFNDVNKHIFASTIFEPNLIREVENREFPSCISIRSDNDYEDHQDLLTIETQDITRFMSLFEASDILATSTVPNVIDDLVISSHEELLQKERNPEENTDSDKNVQQFQESCFGNVQLGLGAEALKDFQLSTSTGTKVNEIIVVAGSKPSTISESKLLPETVTQDDPTETSIGSIDGYDHGDLLTIDKEDIERFLSSFELPLSTSVILNEVEPPATGSNGEEQQQPKHRYRCPKCDQTLSNSAHLKRHLYLKHSPNSISVQCPICFKTFANSLNLERHRRPFPNSASSSNKGKKNLCRGVVEGSRAPDKRLRCGICGQRFVLKSGYNRHLRRKHHI